MFERSGANERIRTADLLITNEPLYQLSYIGCTKTYLQCLNRKRCIAKPWQYKKLLTLRQDVY